MRITELQLRNGEVIPRWYGMAYWRYDVEVGVAYPIPLNLLIRLGRTIYHWIRAGAWEQECSRAFNAGYSRGYNHGRHELFQTGLRDYVQNKDTAEAEYFKRTLK